MIAQGRRLQDDGGAPDMVSTGGFTLMGCQPGYFAQPGEKCVRCAEGMDCSGAQVFDGRYFGEPVAKPGFFMSSTASREEVVCLQPDRSVCLQVLPCEPKEACVGQNQCEKGYADARCAACAKGFYRLSGACEECPKCAKCAFLGFLLFAILACSLGHWLSQKRVKLNMLSIFIDYFQIVSVLAMSNTINWPPMIKRFFAMLSFFNLNLDLMAPECSYPNVPYSVKWSMIMSLPVFAVMFFFLVHVAMYIKKRCIQKRKKALNKHLHLMIGTSLIAFYYFYLYLTKTALDIFNCSPTNPPEVRPDGQVVEYLEVTFAECGKPGGLQMKLVGPASFFFAVYSIGFPTVVGTILYRNRVKVKQDQILRAKNTGNSRGTNPDCYDFRKKYHKIYEMYKPQYYYWSACIMGRKLLIACSGLMFRRSPVFLLAFSLLTLFVAYAMQVRNQPFMHDAEYEQVIEQAEKEEARKSKAFGGQTTLGGNQAPDFKARSGRKNVRLGGSSIELRREHTVSRAIFNYNTIESTLLFCAILIVLSGLMFQSDAIKPGTKWEQGLTLWTYLIVGFSVVFFVGVVGTEIVVGLGCLSKERARKVMRLAGDGSDSDSDDDDRSKSDSVELGGHTNPIFDGSVHSHAVHAALQKHESKRAHNSDKLVASHTGEMADTISDQKAEIRRLKKNAAASHLAGRDLDYAQATSTRNMLHPSHHHHAHHAAAGASQHRAKTEATMHHV
jgi:hypothetical protein